MYLKRETLKNVSPTLIMMIFLIKEELVIIDEKEGSIFS